MPENLLTKSAFAAVLGVDRSQPTRWAQQGMPVEADGKVDAVRAELWVRENIDDLQRSRRSIGTRQLSDGERGRWMKELITAHVVGCDCAASYAAALLMPLLPEPVVRAVTTELLRRLRAGSAECLAEDLPAPKGIKCWLDYPGFQDEAIGEADWQDIRERLAAGELLKVVDG